MRSNVGADILRRGVANASERALGGLDRGQDNGGLVVLLVRNLEHGCGHLPQSLVMGLGQEARIAGHFLSADDPALLVLDVDHDGQVVLLVVLHETLLCLWSGCSSISRSWVRAWWCRRKALVLVRPRP